MKDELKRVIVAETGSTDLPRRSLKRARNSDMELEDDEEVEEDDEDDEDEVVVVVVVWGVEVDSGWMMVACGRGWV